MLFILFSIYIIIIIITIIMVVFWYKQYNYPNNYQIIVLLKAYSFINTNFIITFIMFIIHA